MSRTIQYAINEEDGQVWSRVDSEVAVPVLDFDGIGKGGDGFEPGDFRGPTRYNLERFDVLTVGREWNALKWTRKIPLEEKNLHRQFWGMKPLEG